MSVLDWLQGAASAVVRATDSLQGSIEPLLAPPWSWLASYWVLAFGAIFVLAGLQRLSEGAERLADRVLVPGRLGTKTGLVRRSELRHLVGRFFWRARPVVFVPALYDDRTFLAARQHGPLAALRSVRAVIGAMLAPSLFNVAIWLLVLHHQRPSWFDWRRIGEADVRTVADTIVTADISAWIEQAAALLLLIGLLTGSVVRNRAKHDDELTARALVHEARVMRAFRALYRPLADGIDRLFDAIRSGAAGNWVIVRLGHDDRFEYREGRVVERSAGRSWGWPGATAPLDGCPSADVQLAELDAVLLAAEQDEAAPALAALDRPYAYELAHLTLFRPALLSPDRIGGVLEATLGRSSRRIDALPAAQNRSIGTGTPSTDQDQWDDVREQLELEVRNVERYLTSMLMRAVEYHTELDAALHRWDRHHRPNGIGRRTIRALARK